jgi:hypothetical protein
MKKWDKRKKPTQLTDSKSSPLPADYLKLVTETLTQAMEKGLVELRKTHPVSEFHVDGTLFGDEALVVVTLSHGEHNVVATTVHSSADYNPAAEKPGLEATLAACVDAAASVFEYYLDPTQPARIAQIADRSLGALEDAPFDWTKTGGAWVKLDKSNPQLEAAAEEWLAKNDPDYQARLEREQQEAAQFLNDRLEAIQKAKTGQGGSGPGDQNGPIRH